MSKALFGCAPRHGCRAVRDCWSAALVAALEQELAMKTAVLAELQRRGERLKVRLRVRPKPPVLAASCVGLCRYPEPADLRTSGLGLRGQCPGSCGAAGVVCHDG